MNILFIDFSTCLKTVNDLDTRARSRKLVLQVMGE